MPQSSMLHPVAVTTEVEARLLPVRGHTQRPDQAGVPRARVNTLREIEVTILQGGKAYGSHLHPVPVPAKERWPRGDHEIFYWPQEDLLRERAQGAAWTLSVLRPSMILGESVGSPMSVIAALGVYASLLKHLGEPLRFPGGGRYVTACTDSRLIAQAVEFVAEAQEAAGETFNVVNGDVLVWQDLWPALATHFDMPVADPTPMRLADEMPKQAKVWDEIVGCTAWSRSPWTS